MIWTGRRAAPRRDGPGSLVEVVADFVAAHVERPSWDDYFMATALLISSRSACGRLHVGCVIVSGGACPNRIIAAGYNGFLPGAPHRSRMRDGHEQATVHAEQNAIADAARRGVSVAGSTAYVTHYPCVGCAKMLAAAGVAERVGRRVQHAVEQRQVFAQLFLKQFLVELGQQPVGLEDQRVLPLLKPLPVFPHQALHQHRDERRGNPVPGHVGAVERSVAVADGEVIYKIPAQQQRRDHAMLEPVPAQRPVLRRQQLRLNLASRLFVLLDLFVPLFELQPDAFV
jgi:dCMP deaminase